MHFTELLQKKIIIINQKPYEKLRLGGYFILEKYQEDFFIFAKKQDKNKLKKLIEDIIYLQIGNDIDLSQLEASDVIKIVLRIFEFNRLLETPIFLLPPPLPKNQPKNIEEKKKQPLWEYPGRFIADWINVFASRYGWEVDKILNLDVDIAVHLMQEILIDLQLEKEWQYQLTEIAYPYDSGTKQSSYKPLKRPFWMSEESTKEITTTKLLKSSLPFGVVGFGNVDLVSADEKIIDSIIQKDSTRRT